MTSDELFEQFRSAFVHRKFVAGLLIAMIDLLDELNVFLPASPVHHYPGLLEHHPRVTTTAAGKNANTLILRLSDGGTKSLRPYYNSIERYFRGQEKRFDYPSCAPHATQAWTDYTHWLDGLCSMSEAEAAALRQRVIQHVLTELPDQGFDPKTVSNDPPVFRMLLEDFDFSAAPKEKPGAALQGAVFGFIRADNPHLQVEIDKVRTGSSLRSRIGDVDAWEADRLRLSAEVKSRHVSVSLREDLQSFVHEIARRGAIGLLVALSFDPEARNSFENEGIATLDLQDLVQIVRLWDPAKQQIAVNSMMYYVAHVERNSPLKARLDRFLGDLKDSENRAGA